MNPYRANKLPTEYKIDKDMLKLISEANEKYGEYKSLLNTLEFDSKFFLDSVLLNESYKSTQIEGTQISQDEMYYLKYMDKTDDNREIQNLKDTIGFAYRQICEGREIGIALVNDMHKMIFHSVRRATFVPPVSEEVHELLMNLYEYMNDRVIDPLLVNVAVSHVQFETIHAYKDGNGRLGRALISLQMAMLDEEKPILFLSEILELYKPSYQRNLMESRRGNMAGFIKFFLQCVIDQCNHYIYKIGRIKQIYREDMKKIDAIKGNTVYKIMPIIMQQIVFTKKEVQDASGASESTVSNIINQLAELNIIIPDSTVNKKGYRYQRIYEVFVDIKEFM